jgi:hypothetical protein
MLGKEIGRIAEPIANRLTPEEQARVDLLTKEGVPLDLAQRTGSEFLQRIKSGLSRAPVTSQWAHDNAAAQQTATNAALLRQIGADSERADPVVMQKAKSAIGDIYDAAASRGSPLDVPLASALQGAQRSILRTVPDSSRGPITTQINDLLESAGNNGGHIDGQILQRVNSDLGKMSSNKDFGDVASYLRRALANAMQRNAPTPEAAAELQQARVQYRNLKQIEPAVRDGDISPKVIAGVQRRPENINQSVYGQGDQNLGQIARAAAAVLPETMANSGTPGGHAALGTIGAAGAISAPLLYSAGHSFLSGEPMESEHLQEAGKRSAEVAGVLGAMMLARKGFSTPAVANYLAEGVGGSANSGQAAQLARQLLKAPENNKLLQALMRTVPPARALAPQAPEQ